MRSKVLQRILDEMDKDPWHVKLKRWYNLEKWVLICRTRKYWDKEYEYYIWKNYKPFTMNKNQLIKDLPLYMNGFAVTYLFMETNCNIINISMLILAVISFVWFGKSQKNNLK